MLDEMKSTLEDLKDKIQSVKDYLKLSAKQTELKNLEDTIAGADFWQKSGTQDVIDKVKELKLVVEPWLAMDKQQQHLAEMIELLQMENDEDLAAEVARDLQKLEDRFVQEELKTFLSGKADKLNAYLEINAGAGGTESCDWASMLLRMYTRWAEEHEFKVEVVEHLAGEEAGVKNVTLLIKGLYAYGYLKAEMGVHRLVRISPFDANKKRHTSFASVDVTPEIVDDVEIEILDADIKIDTYRASGAGGQHVNKTDSAVRITHMPTGIVVQCQQERSQHKNKAAALKMLKSKLYDLELQKREAENSQAYAQKGEIAWGNQIRSYVFQPYTMVKDHRTNEQSGNIIAVMDGRIDKFIEAFLKKS